MRKLRLWNHGPIPLNSLNLLVMGLSLPVNNAWEQYVFLSKDLKSQNHSVLST